MDGWTIDVQNVATWGEFMFGTSKKRAPYVKLPPPAVGRTRVPDPNLTKQRRRVDRMFALMQELDHEPVADSGRVMAGELADDVVRVVAGLTGENVDGQRAKLASFAHVGWSIATLEERSGESATGMTEPHAHTMLVFVALENRSDDALVKAVSDWALEAGYYLARLAETAEDLLAAERADEVVAALRADLPELFPGRVTAPPVKARPAELPKPRPRRASVDQRRRAAG